jgi:hypothetical protein
MEIFEWWPAEFFILAQMGLGLVVLLAFSVVKASPSRLASPAAKAPNVLPMPKRAPLEEPERLAA